MLAQRLACSKQILKVKNAKSWPITCQTCREIRECKLPSTNEIPFLWTPLSTDAKGLDLNEFITSYASNTCRKAQRTSLKGGSKATNGSGMHHGHKKPFQVFNGVNETCIFEMKNLYPTAMEEALLCEKCVMSHPNDAYFIDDGSCSCGRKDDQSLQFKKIKNSRKKLEEIKKKISTQELYFNKSFDVKAIKNKINKKVPGRHEVVLQEIASNLQTEWPDFFDSKVVADFSSLSDSIFFDNAVLGLKTRGLKWYKLQLYLFKWATKLVWFDSSLQILQLTKNVQDSTVRVRWLTSGKPRLLFPLLLLGREPSLRYMDFFSILKVGETEKIEAHKVTKLVPWQSSQKWNPAVSLLTLFGLAGRNIPELEEKPVLPTASEPGGY